jgi:PKD repeat protein
MKNNIIILIIIALLIFGAFCGCNEKKKQVVETNSLPTASFTFDKSINYPNEEIELKDNSLDYDGNIIAWSWDLGDGTSSEEQNVTHSYSEAGSYNVKLIVTDDSGGKSETYSLNISILENPTVAIFVDDYTYGNLIDEIKIFEHDIENDLKANVYVYHDNWENSDMVRDKLIEIKDENLVGSILIGDIPLVYFERYEEGKNSPGHGPSDRYYMDLESSLFIDQDNDGIFNSTFYWIKNDPMKIIWTGRIKPYLDGQDGINQLKDYFERNHNYRTGKITVDQKLLLYSPSISSGPSGSNLEIYLDNLEDSVTRTDLYSFDDFDYLVNCTKGEFLESLETDYEICSIPVEGFVSTQEIGTGITTQDILDAQPKPYFYYLFTYGCCDLSYDDYLGGHYLFDGNGLVVQGDTISPGISATEAVGYFDLLALGHTFGDALIHKGYREIYLMLLGDPTLNIRHLQGFSQIEVNRTSVDFGEVKVGDDETELISFTNKGIGKAIVDNSIYSLEKISEDTNDEINTSGNGDGTIKSMKLTVMFFNEIESQQTKDMTCFFSPDEKGDYEGYVVVSTNDPTNKVIIIEIKAKAV